jgi:uncharacterized protein YkwD
VSRLLTTPAAALAATALIAIAAPVAGAGARTAQPAIHRAAHGHSSSGRRHACRNARLRPTRKNLGLVRAATLCLINRQRAMHGEHPLRPNRRLRRAAQAHSASMASEDYFEHVGPRGQTPLARMRSVGYISSSRVGYEVGENIAWGTLRLASPRAIVAAWMASPGHRANILDPRYRETGIGVCAHPPSALAHGQPGAIYTQDFGVIIAG